jgi:hypothetical protein
MARLSIMRRDGATGKFRNQEPLQVAFTDAKGLVALPASHACSWEDFQFHLATVTTRNRLHQADRDLRAGGRAEVEVDDGLVDEAWLKSFVLTED